MSLHYRPEIDGLRAVAVVAVILYHADFAVRGSTPFAGGFIGVDIFFVISGYLITSIILKELKEDSFSFSHFYVRRARRILPALYTVMLASVPFAWIYMLPAAMKAYAGSILASMAFSSNFWFLAEDGYSAEPSALKPFLHTWSLSVEEQFYVVFPVALVLLWRYARSYVGPLLGFALVVSFLLAEVGSRTHPDATFFLLPTRAWELLCGAIMAYVEAYRGRAHQRLLAVTMPAAGLFLLGLGFFLFDDRTRHPSLVTLAPVIGTMLLIWFCTKGERVSDMLASKPFMAIGLVSYSLYLWHFPLFAFARIALKNPTSLEKIALIGLSAGLSVATYLLVERPARSSAATRLKPFVGSVAAVSAMIMCVAGYFYQTNGVSSRFAGFANIIELNYWNGDREQRYTDYATHYGCWVWVENIAYDRNDPFGSCRRQEKFHGGKRIMLIGDSHAAGLSPGLVHHFGRDSLMQRTASSCLPAPNYVSGNRRAHSDYCKIEMAQAFADIAILKPDLIVIGANWRSRRSFDYKRYLTQELPALLGDRMASTIIVGPLVRWGGNGLRETLLDIYSQTNVVPDRLEPDPASFQLDRELADIARQIGAGYLSPVSTLCSDGKCLTKVGPAPDAVTSWDTAHISLAASRFLIERNYQQLRRYLD